ncbi:MAG: hypothetical protein J5897_03935 [Candidatus Methanomethylophilus sp.]|nr:hypothetical protein [Methanomethylophilus sp.]
MTQWKPCPVCKADGYVLHLRPIGWTCDCPKCGSVLTSGATRTQAIMFYTATHRVVA